MNALRSLRSTTVALVCISVLTFSVEADDQQWVPVADWDPTAGQPGISGTVRAMAVLQEGDSETLYVSQHMGSTNYEFARLSDGEWTPIDVGIGDSETGGRILTMTIFDAMLGDGPELYVGGLFDSIAGVPATSLAKWNPKTSQWTAVAAEMTALACGSNAQPWVLSLKAVEGALYIGGVFDSIDGIAANNIARYQPAADAQQPWFSLGEGLAPGCWSEVTAIERFEDGGPGTGHGHVIYAGGTFGLARFDPQNETWVGIPGTANMYLIHALTTFQGAGDDAPYLYVGGWFDWKGIQRWDGEQWVPMSHPWNYDEPTLQVYAMHVAQLPVKSSNGDGASTTPFLVVGGDFSSAGPLHQMNGLAAFDGESWRRLAGGVGGVGFRPWSRAIAASASGDEPRLFVGGRFTHAEGHAVGNIASVGLSTIAVEPCPHEHLATIVADEPPDDSSIFGISAATDGESLLVSHPHYQSGGWVYAFEQHADDWVLVQTIEPPPGETEGWFGSPLRLEGGVLYLNGCGSWCVYERGSDGAWSFVGPFPAAGTSNQSEWFVDSHTFSPQGSMNIYMREGDDWVQVQTLPSGPRSLHGNRLLLGQTGGALLYEWDGAEWNVATALEFDHPGSQNVNGVLLHGAIAFVSQPRTPGTHEFFHLGAVHVFEEIDGSWEQTAIVYGPSNIAPRQYHSERLIATAGNYYWSAGLGMPRRVLMFDRIEEEWVKNTWFTFGQNGSVTFGGHLAVSTTGDPYFDSHWEVNVFDIGGCLDDATGPIFGDLNGDGVVNQKDLVILVHSFGPCPDPNDCPADLNGDGVVNAKDLLLLLGAMAPAKPGGPQGGGNPHGGPPGGTGGGGSS